MQINISGKHVSLTPAIEDYARKKVEKFSRYFDRIQAIDVVIDKLKNGFSVEIRTDVEHHDDFVARSEHDDLYACIDLTADRSIRQLTDHKSRVRDRQGHLGHHNSAGRSPGAAEGPA
jgi:putative sigma-54 modulation protein